MTNNKLLRILQGEEVNLHEIDPGLHKVHVGLGWDAPEESRGLAVDLDGSAFLLTRENPVRKNSEFVFYNNLETDGGVIKHLGDNLTGNKSEGKGEVEGEAKGGDDAETIE